MCGIAGFMAPEPGASPDGIRDTVSRMTNSLRHRGPDDSGIWLDPAVPVALGHRRLAINDLSARGSQPMVSASGRYILVFNGEIYNFRELRPEFPAYPFAGNSDTEVMLAAFERYGLIGSLRRFNGMFAFALWDRAERILHLACDQFGEKPLYYGMAGTTLVFGSELKALTAHQEFDASIHRGVVPLFLRYGCVPKPWSIYRNARKLEPGTHISFSWANFSAVPQREIFWSAREASGTARRHPFQGTPTEAVDELERLLGESVRKRMMGDVPLGAFLSGGVDSAAVVALMQQYGSRPARTFTIGCSEKSSDESDEARAVARHLGTDHAELLVTPAEAMSVIPRLSAIYDEPFADSSQVPVCLVSELARRHVTVALSGDGGDEVFGGYNRYVWAGKIWDTVRHFPRLSRSLGARLVTSISPSTWDRWNARAPFRFRMRAPGDKMHKLASILDAGTEQELYCRLTSQWADPESVALHPGGSPCDLTDPAIWNNDGTFLQRMMLADSIGYLPDDILVKVDRAAMAVGLETRLPYLDSSLFEFAWSLPDEWKVRAGEGKWLLRQVLSRYVPKTMMDRPKAGFGIPIDVWLRGPLRDWAENLLDERRLQQEGFFNPRPIRIKWDQHLAGSRNWYPQLWAVLMFQDWIETTRRDPAYAADARLTVVS